MYHNPPNYYYIDPCSMEVLHCFRGAPGTTHVGGYPVFELQSDRNSLYLNLTNVGSQKALRWLDTYESQGIYLFTCVLNVKQLNQLMYVENGIVPVHNLRKYSVRAAGNKAGYAMPVESSISVNIYSFRY